MVARPKPSASRRLALCRRTWKEVPLGRPTRRQRRDTVADTEFGISGDLSDIAFGRASVRAHVAHVAPERGGTARSTRQGLRQRRARPVLRLPFAKALGGNWGYPDVHNIGNSGKDG